MITLCYNPFEETEMLRLALHEKSKHIKCINFLITCLEGESLSIGPNKTDTDKVGRIAIFLKGIILSSSGFFIREL